MFFAALWRNRSPFSQQARQMYAFKIALFHLSLCSITKWHTDAQLMSNGSRTLCTVLTSTINVATIYCNQYETFGPQFDAILQVSCP